MRSRAGLDGVSGTRGKVLKRQTVIGCGIQQVVQPLQDELFFHLQMAEHLRKQTLGNLPELRPPPFAGTVPEDLDRQRAQPMGRRLDRHVLFSELIGDQTVAVGPDQRKHLIFFERIVGDDVIEKADQAIDLFCVVVISGLECFSACLSTDPVLQFADRHQDAEVLFMQHLPQPCQFRHTPFALVAARIAMCCAAAHNNCDAIRISS